MPVDMSIPNSIIGAYLQGLRLRQEREQNQQSLELRAAQMKQAHDQFTEQIKVRREQMDLQSKVNESLIKSRLAQEQTAKAQRAMAAATLIDKGILTAQPTINPDEDVYDFSIFGEDWPQIKVRSAKKRQEDTELAARNAAAAAGQKAGEVAKATQPYKIDFEKFKSQLSSEKDLSKLEGQLTNRLKELEVKHDYDLELEKERQQGRMAVAALKRKKEEAGGITNWEGWIEDLKSGDTTLETLGKADVKTRTGVLNLANELGVKVLNNKDTQTLTALGGITKLYQLAREMNEIIQKDSWLARANSEYLAKAETFDALASKFRGMIGESGAFTDKDLDRIIALRPTTATKSPATFNAAKMREFEKEMKTFNDLHLRRFGPEQKLAIIDKFKLLPDPNLEPAK